MLLRHTPRAGAAVRVFVCSRCKSGDYETEANNETEIDIGPRIDWPQADDQ